MPAALSSQIARGYRFKQTWNEARGVTGCNPTLTKTGFPGSDEGVSGPSVKKYCSPSPWCLNIQHTKRIDKVKVKNVSRNNAT
ncbi:hypothetical protein BH11PLA1_BH11PLA1_01230 [soil metagenome]